MIEMMTEMMTETMKEKMTGLQVPESFVTVTGSGSLMDRKYILNVLEVDPRMDRKWIKDGQEVVHEGQGVGPGWTGSVSRDRQQVGP